MARHRCIVRSDVHMAAVLTIPVSVEIVRRFVSVPAGVIHLAEAGEGKPVLLLHQTPRSSDEYRDVLPILGQRRRAIAMDTLGFGASSRLPEGEYSIEKWAAGVIELLDALGIDRADVVGHHTGAVIATELAAVHRDRVRSVVLSSNSFVDSAYRSANSGPAVVDEAMARPDGSHLVELWRSRSPYYPPGDTALLERYIIDALRAGPLAAEGHRIVARYPMEDRLPLIECPVLLIGATDDPHSYPDQEELQRALSHAKFVEIEGGMVPLPDHMPDAFCSRNRGFPRRTR